MQENRLFTQTLMQIGKILYPVTTLGPGKRTGIWTTGCNRRCKGCSNPELRMPDSSAESDVKEVAKRVLATGCEGVTVSGGEPFLQKKELAELIRILREGGIDDILVYTGYLKEELEDMKDADTDFILGNITALIDGPFVQELVDDKPLRGSSNQRVIVFDEKYREKYDKCLKEEKRVDIFEFDGETHFIGIPFRDYEKLYKEYIMARRI